MERVLIEPLPWPGDMSAALRQHQPRQQPVEVADAKTGDLLYSRDFSTVFGEWRTTEEANQAQPRLPGVGALSEAGPPVRVRILKRDERNAFSVAWSVEVDTDAQDVVRKQPPPPAKPIAIRSAGRRRRRSTC
jgi:hypothetical protein